MFTPYFVKKIWPSFWVFVFLIISLWLVRNKHLVIPILEDLTGLAWKVDTMTTSEQIKELIPNHNYKDELISQPSYMVSFDPVSLQPRFTIHLLIDSMTRGTANRKGLRIDDTERIYSHTAKHSDYSHTGYDRGHMVPAGDFSCCQVGLEDTFKMSNIAAFDSVLNRYAWQDLEKYTRKMARKYEQLWVITGTVFNNRKTIGRSNRIQVPSHFYKILIRFHPSEKVPEAVVVYLMKNKPIYNFKTDIQKTTIDEIEKLTVLDYFYRLESAEQANFEGSLDVGKW